MFMHIEPSAIQGTLYHVGYITPDEKIAPSAERERWGMRAPTNRRHALPLFLRRGGLRQQRQCRLSQG